MQFPNFKPVMLVFRALVLHVGLGGECSSYDQTVRDVIMRNVQTKIENWHSYSSGCCVLA